jgi:hypothetical protein
LDSIEKLKQLFKVTIPQSFLRPQIPEVPDSKIPDTFLSSTTVGADAKKMFDVDTYENSKLLSPLGRDQVPIKSIPEANIVIDTIWY